MKRLIFAFIALAVLCDLGADNNFSKKIDVQNNAFTLERGSWIFVSSDRSGAASFGTRKFVLENGKGFVELSAGRHTLAGVPGGKITLRQVPELVFYKFAGRFDRPDTAPFDLSVRSAHGRDAMFLYNWNWLRKHILPNFTTVATMLEAPQLDQWRAAGALLAAVKAVDGRIVWEAYSFSRDWKREIADRLERRGKEFLQCDREFMRYTFLAPSTMEFSDKNAEVDFKVFLDRQFHLATNSPDFAGIASIAFWTSTSTKPEILRWFAALVRHYCVRGETTLLSERFGFVIEPGILRNPEWSDGLKHWKCAPAAPGSLFTVARSEWPQYGFKPGYNLKAPHRVLLMKHVPGEVNSVRQTLNNLSPRRSYVLTLQTAGLSRPPQQLETYALSFAFENCVVEDVLMRPMLDYTSSKSYNTCWNNYEIRFRRTNERPATLTVSDRNGNGGVRAPLLLVDGVRIAPFFQQPR